MLGLDGCVLTKTGSRTWSCQIARFLRKRHTEEKEHPLNVLELNVTTQVLVLHDGQLYMRTNYNMMVDHYYPTGGWEGNPGVYKIEVSPAAKFDWALTRLEPFLEVRKGKKHPQNIYPRDHERSMEEGVHAKIVSAADSPDGLVEVEVAHSPPALNMLRERFENVPVLDATGRVNAWWIKTPDTQDAFWVRFADTLVYETEGETFLRIRNRPRGLYRKVPHEEKWITEPFFQRIHEMRK